MTFPPSLPRFARLASREGGREGGRGGGKGVVEEALFLPRETGYDETGEE